MELLRLISRGANDSGIATLSLMVVSYENGRRTSMVLLDPAFPSSSAPPLPSQAFLTSIGMRRFITAYAISMSSSSSGSTLQGETFRGGGRALGTASSNHERSVPPSASRGQVGRSSSRMGVSRSNALAAALRRDRTNPGLLGRGGQLLEGTPTVLLLGEEDEGGDDEADASGPQQVEV